MSLVILRHGPTAATPLAGSPKASGPNLPLSPDAKAALLKTISQLPAVDKIYASDLQRGTETAKIWHQQTGAPIEVHPALESWDLGKFRGSHAPAADAVVRELVKHPERKPPGGGESFHQFLTRLLPQIVPLIADDQLHGMVGHSRSIKTIQAYLAAKGQGIDLQNWQDEPILKPAQAIVVGRQGVQQAA